MSPTYHDVHIANKAMRQAKSCSNHSLKFPKNAVYDKILVYSDASFQNLPNGGSQGGYIILLFDSASKKAVCLYWSSRKVRRVARSTLGAETLALQDGLDCAVFFQKLWKQIADQYLKIFAITDNYSLYSALPSGKSVEEKRLRIEISAIKELCDSGDLEKIFWVSTNEQIADCLTKKTGNSESLWRVLRSNYVDLSKSSMKNGEFANV